VVWIPKYRRRILNPGVQVYLSRLFPKVLSSLPGCEMVEHSVQVDHIHMLLVIPPKYAVSAVIGQMKQYTASRLRKKFAWLEKVYWNEPVVWSPGYFVSTVGLNEEQVIEYVKWQAHQDSGQAKLEL
jgi:putative transposase